MIKININDSTINWYWNRVNKNLYRRVKTYFNKRKSINELKKHHNKLYQNIFDNINEDIEHTFNDTDYLKDLITLPVNTIIKKYKTVKWFKLYISMCDYFRCKYDNESQLDKVKNNVLIDIVNEFNNIFSKMIDYKYLNAIRGELVNKMSIKVCPYCNGQYVNSYKYIDKHGKFKYLGDLDHLMPKKLYQLFSMSIYNLVPSCKHCNQSLKNQKLINLLNPYENGFFKAKYMKIIFKDSQSINGFSDNFDIRWQDYKDNDALSVSNLQKINMNNNIEIFRLNEIYTAEKEIIKDVLFKRYAYRNEGYTTSLKHLLGNNLRLNKIIYGVSMEPELFKDELFSHMIYDIVYHN